MQCLTAYKNALAFDNQLLSSSIDTEISTEDTTEQEAEADGEQSIVIEQSDIIIEEQIIIEQPDTAPSHESVESAGVDEHDANVENSSESVVIESHETGLEEEEVNNTEHVTEQTVEEVHEEEEEYHNTPITESVDILEESQVVTKEDQETEGECVALCTCCIVYTYTTCLKVECLIHNMAIFHNS